MQENGSDSIPVAEIVPPPAIQNYQPPTQPKMGGCLIAALVGIILLVIVLVGGGVLVYQVAKRAQQQQQNIRNPTNVQRGNSQATGSLRDSGDFRSQFADFADAKKVFDAGPDNSPLQPRFVAFAEELQEACDDTANAKIQALIDYPQYGQEASHYTSIHGNRLFFPDDVVQEFRQFLTGPIPFSSYQIIRVKRLGPKDYAIYTSSRSEYGHYEPVIWWVNDRSGKLKLCDWLNLELGIRSSHETAVIYMAQQHSQLSNYERLNELSDQYFGVTNENSPERKQEITRVLSEMEKVTLPRQVDASGKFITALRWFAEGEYERTLRLLQRIESHKVPGRFRLEGDCHLELGDYKKAIGAYLKFHANLGQNAESLLGLIACYEELGELDNELETHLNLVRFRGEVENYHLVRMLSICDKQKAAQVFETVNALPESDSFFAEAILTFGVNSFGKKRLGWLVEFLKVNSADSKALQAASVKQLIINRNWTEVASLLDGLTAEEDATFRDSVWTDVANRGMAADVFAKSKMTEVDLQNLREIYEGYYTDLDLDTYLKVCNLFNQTNPNNYVGYLAQGIALNSNGDYEKAIQPLQKASSLIGEEIDEFEESLIHEQMLDANYHADQHDGLLDFAVDHGLVDQLLRYKTYRDDFDDIDELIELAEDPSQYEGLKCRETWSLGKKEEAIQKITELVKADETNFMSSNQRTLMQWCLELGTPNRAFELTSSYSIFETLLSNAAAQKNWDECRNLIQLGKNRVAAAELLNFEIEFLWAMGDYDAVVRTAQNQSLEIWNLQSLSQIVRSAIRTDQIDLAEHYAEEARISFDAPRLQTIVLLKKQQYETATNLIDRIQYDQTFFLTDPDVTFADADRLLTLIGPTQLDSHDNYRDESLRLFLKSEKELSNAKMKELLQQWLPEAQISVEENGNHLLVRAGQLTVALTQKPTEPGEWKCDDNQMQELFEQASHSLAIDTTWRGFTQDDRSLEIAMRLANSLCDDDCLAVENVGWVTAKGFRDNFAKCVKTQHFTSNDSNEYIWGYSERTPTDSSAEDRFLVKLAKAFDAFDTGEATEMELQLQIALELGDAVELMPVVAKATQLEFGFQAQFTGELQNASQLKPQLKPGLLLEFSHENIRSFKFTIDGETSEASLN